ncbi:MAG: hypothetical protein M3N31_02095 [Actinomycetota bacterium]|nr:hypothetical protein [Actinomycetota bacterium]
MPSLGRQLRNRYRDWPSIADQVVSTASNFLVVALVARGAGPAGYAPFAMALVVWLLTLGIQRAVLIEPMALLASRHQGERLAAHMKGAMSSAVLFAIACGALAAAVSGTMALLGAAPETTRTAFGFSLALPLLLLQDAVRWQFLSLRTGMGALKNDAVFAVAELLPATGLLLAGRLNAATGFLAVASGAAIATAYGIAQLRDRLSAPVPFRGKAEPAAGMPGWLLVDFLYWWVYAQAMLFVVAGLLGNRDAGLYRAMHDLFGPLRLANLSLLTVLLPASAEAFNLIGSARLRQTVRRAIRLTTPLAGAYCTLAALVGPLLVRSLYGPAFELPVVPLVLLSAGYFLNSAQLPLVVTMKASRQARRLALGRLAIAPLVLSAFPLLTDARQLMGASVAYLAASVLNGLVVARQVRTLVPTALVEGDEQPGVPGGR